VMNSTISKLKLKFDTSVHHSLDTSVANQRPSVP
jgi:hypothetical protein